MLAAAVRETEAVSSEAFGGIADLADWCVLALQFLRRRESNEMWKKPLEEWMYLVLGVGQLGANLGIAQEALVLGLDALGCGS